MDNYGQNNQNSFIPNSYNQNDMYAQGASVVTKKSKLPFILGGVGVVVAAAAAVCLLVPSVNNSLRMALMSPSKYLTHVESVNFEAYAEEAGDAYGDILALLNNENGIGVNYDMSLEFGSDLKEEIATQFGDEIKLDSVGAAFSFNAKDANMSLNGTLNLNDKKLIDMDAFSDKESLYARIPALSSAYIFQKYSELEGSEEFAEIIGKISDGIDKNPITEKDVEALVNKYAPMIFEALGDVKLDKNQTGTINDVDYDYNKLTAELTEAEATECALKILGALKEDEIIKNFFTATGICTESEYTAKIDELIATVNEDKPDENNKLTIELYVNSVGKIMGRSYTMTNSEGTTPLFKYLTAEKNDDFSASFEMDMEEEGSITLDIKPTGEKGVYDGSYKLVFVDYSDEETTMEISFEDIKVVNEEKGYVSGKYTLSGNFFDDLDADVDKLEFVMESDGKSQTTTSTIGELLTVKTTYSLDDAAEITAPSDSDTKYDLSDDAAMQEYIASINYDELIDNLADCIGMPAEDIETLLGYMLGSGLGATDYGMDNGMDYGYYDSDFDTSDF